MEPITTAALVAGTVALAKKAAEAAAGKLGEAAVTKAKEYWGKVKALLGLQADPAPEQLEDAVGSVVYAKAGIRPQLQALLEEHDKAAGTALVGSLHVEKGTATVVGQNSGIITNTNTFTGS